MCSVCAQLILGKVRGKMGRKKDENVLRIILFQKILEKSRAKLWKIFEGKLLMVFGNNL